MCTPGSGKIIKCMEREFIHGKTAGSMKENIVLIRSMGMEFISGPTAEGMRGTGKMGNDKEEGNIF